MVVMESLDKVVWRVHMRHWWLAVLFLQLFLMALMSGCLATHRWVRQGTNEFKWEGGLLKCHHCLGTWDDQYYHDIVAQVCHQEGSVYNSWCNQFSDLRYAGRAFLAVDIFCLAVLLLWTGKTVAILNGRNFLRDWVFTVLGLFACCCHIAVVIQWHVVTMSFFYGDCYHLSDGQDRANLCALDGPMLAVALCVLLPLLTLLWVALKAKSAPPRLEEPDEEVEKKPEEVVDSDQVGLARED